MRIAIAQFSHETCTFCPERTTIERLDPYVLRGTAVFDKLRGIPNYINGFLNILENQTDIELIPIISVVMAPGPYTSWFTPQCFNKYCTEIQERLKAAGKLDGVLLALHGAMAVEGTPKPEAEITRRVRSVVGDIPIMVTLDLHANEDQELTEAADGVFILKTYPHLDAEEIGETAAKCLLDTLAGRVKPTQVLKKPGIVSASIFQASEYYPMKVLYDLCRKWEKHAEVICVSVAPGYAYADVVDIGMSIVAVTNNNYPLANQIVDELMAKAWELREALNRRLPDTRTGIAEVIQLVADGKGPVLIADGADRTGDSTHVLKELLEQDACNFAIPGLADPKVAKWLEANHQVGDTVSVTIGGWASEYSGTPVEITGSIEYIGRPQFTLNGPMGKGSKIQDGLCVRLNLGKNRQVVITERLRFTNDSSGLAAVGIDYTTLDIIALKDRVHHRAFWDSYCQIDFPIDAPGIGAANLLTLTYHNAPADAYPIGANYR